MGDGALGVEQAALTGLQQQLPCNKILLNYLVGRESSVSFSFPSLP